MRVVSGFVSFKIKKYMKGILVGGSDVHLIQQNNIHQTSLDYCHIKTQKNTYHTLSRPYRLSHTLVRLHLSNATPHIPRFFFPRRCDLEQAADPAVDSVGVRAALRAAALHGGRETH